MFIVFDTETTGLPKNWKAPLTDVDNWPRMVQLAWQCHDVDGKFLYDKNHVIIPDGYTIPDEVVNVHGITTEIAYEKGIPLKEALEDFIADVKKCRAIVGHNIDFDIKIVGAELLRTEMEEILSSFPRICTMIESTEYCAIMKNGKPKRPTLTELHTKLFGVAFAEAHNAAADVEATTRCFLELIRVGGMPNKALHMSVAEITAFREINTDVIQPAGIKYESFKVDVLEDISIEEEEKRLREAAKSGERQPFVHLHVHTQYSILDGAAKTADIAAKAKADGMPAVAITDHGSMFGVKEFHVACSKAEIKPIIGVEAYVARRSIHDKQDKSDGSGHHIILLAKNYKGYQNLMALTSIAHNEGMYYKPRIDKDLLKKHSEGVIVSSACLGGEVAQHIMNGNLDKAKETILWYKGVFGDDYYLEMMRHKNDDKRLRTEIYENQVKVNKVLVDLGKELGVKYIATNDSHFVNPEDAEAHDVLVCLSTGRDYDDETRMRYTKQEWFKTTDEMNELFADYPEALSNTVEIADKVEFFQLNSDPIMPPFDIPKDFGTFESYKEKYSEEAIVEEFSQKSVDRLGGYEKVLQIKLESDYLEYLTYEGVKKRYPGDEFTQDKKERIDFELDTIKTMGFPGYFLIVQDFINWAKDNGVLVGPGRGSAAGAAVAYCVGITDVDPIKYDLLFERFLNPDRISMPDVDIDFDDDGRQAVLDYVTNKYGQEKVAHICTFGTMATKSSIKDVARVLRLDLSEANRLAKMVPEAPKMSFKKAYKEEPELLKEKDSLNPLIARTMRFAEALEGSVRQTGVHACGILIGKNALSEHVPVMPTKGEDLLTTQYDGRFVEDIGLLKMDFLGLKTLSIIKEVLSNIKLSKGIDIDINNVPLEDDKAFELFSRGETTAIFQFESPGMKKHLRALKPNRFEDLVAMNALYRPGPMEYIPSFIERKHGREEIQYDHPMMEPYLKDTYGITVYQEQVMLQSRALGGFTRGDSDSLRKAMGKKIIAMMDKLKEKFIVGCKDSKEFMDGCKGKDVDKLIDKIWGDWEAFASYAFNKSHSVCYAYIAYQTGYLKAHYPAEFMAGVLSRNLSDITKITTFMEECKNMGMDVLGPDVNESYRKFTVNKSGAIRFGMAGIKGVGEGAVEVIIKEREENGPYKDVFDFVERLPLTTVNKKNLEALADAGAFDGMGDIHRAQFFASNPMEDTNFIENLIRYGNKYQADKATTSNSLFGSLDGGIEIKKPDVPKCEPYSNIEKLNREKEVIGIYLSAHPLDDFKIEFNFINTELKQLSELEELNGREVSMGGMVTNVRRGTTKKGNPFAIMTLEDFSGSYEFAFFGPDYTNFMPFLENGFFLMIKGRVQGRKFNQEELEVKINHISFLSEVRDKMVNCVTLKVPLQSVNEELITELSEMTKTEEGKALKFIVFDPETKNSVQLLARSAKVDLSDDLVRYIEGHPELTMTFS